MANEKNRTPGFITRKTWEQLGRFGQRFFTRSIHTRLVTTFVVVAVFSMGSVAFLADRSLRRNLTTSIIESQVSLATSQGFQIGQAIISQLDKLQGLATIKTIQVGAETASQEETRPADIAEIEQLNLNWRATVAAQDKTDPLAIELLYNPLSTQLRNFQKTFPENLEILLTDQRGFSIASTGLPANYYQADTLWWRTAHTTGRYIGQPIFNPGTNSITLDIAVPVFSYSNGEFMGVLQATVSFDMLSDLLIKGLRGQTGYSIIYQPNDQEIRLRSLGNNNYEIVQDFASTDLQEFAHSSETNMELSLDGIPVLASSAPVRSYSTTTAREGVTALDDLGWRVIVVQEKAEALQFVNIQARNNLILVMLLGFAVIGIAYLLARLITGPIIQLNMVALQVASGDLNAEARVGSRDEIGTLAMTFNNMTSQLRSLIGSLEQRVLDRTHDLELAAEVGRTVTEKIADLDELLITATEMIRSRFDLYYTQVYLASANGGTLTLHAGTGEVGRQLLEQKHRLIVDSNSLNGQAVLEKKPVIVPDTLQNPNFKPNPLLLNTRSEMVVPLIVGDQVIGALDMQSERPGALNENNLIAFKTLAGQLAIAIQNATLLEQAKEARVNVEAQIRQRTAEGWQDFLNAIEQEQRVGFAYDLANIREIEEDRLSAPSEESLSTPLAIMGTQLGKIDVVRQPDQRWTAGDAEIVRAAAAQLAQHIENLRLLAQAKRYQTQAEQAVRRLTREGWDAYLYHQAETGYFYDLNRVRPLSANGKHSADQPIKQPLIVGDETIGEFELDLRTPSEEAIEIVSAVSDQLSSHIENLRLLEETELQRGQLTEALRASRLGYWEYDFLNDRFTFNDQFYAVFRTTAEQQGGYTMSSAQYAERFVHPEDLPIVGAEIQKAVETTDPNYKTQMDHRVIFADGKIGYVNVRFQIEKDSQGRTVRSYGANQDITERMRAEESIRKRAAELQTVAEVSTTTASTLEPDRLLQAVVDLTKEQFGLYHVHIYLFNESWNTLLLTVGAGEVGRTMVTEGWNIPLDHSTSIVADTARNRKPIIANDVVRDRDSSFLSNRLLPDTRSEMAVPIIVGEKVLGVFDVQSDVVERFTEEDANIFTTLATQVGIALQNARLYAEQTATVAQLRELDKLKSSFLANMSHELRTPLNSILGFTDVMLEGLDGPLTDYMENDLRLVQKNGQHLLHLINDVLDMAKIEAGRMNLHPETFQAIEVIEEVISITSTLAGEKNLSLLIKEDADRTTEIYADRTRLRQVMINLVNNAIKFTEKGHVTIGLSPMDGARMLISVKDTGISIPPEKLEAIFQEFTQVDSSSTRKSGGTGLGLPISRRLVEMHGGRLWAESSGNPGEGSTFFVELPLEARISEVVEKQEK